MIIEGLQYMVLENYNDVLSLGVSEILFLHFFENVSLIPEKV